MSGLKEIPLIFVVREAGWVKGPSKAVLIALTLRTGKDKRAPWPSIRLIARDSGFSERTVKRALSNLQRLDVVRVRNRPGRSSFYHVNDKRIRELGTANSNSSGQADPTEEEGSSARPDWPEPQSVSRGSGDVMAHDSSIESSNNENGGTDGFERIRKLNAERSIEAEIAFVEALEAKGYGSVATALLIGNEPAFRLYEDTSSTHCSNRPSFLFVWYAAAIGKDKRIPKAIFTLGLHCDQLISWRKFERLQAEHPDRHFSDVPVSTLKEALSG
ncbi:MULTISPECIES: helix-turn-helix domain-containing protein [Hyphobacterium]|uniref:Helix-turn-helix domain-containing protein n=1 Tax=Hyphobacterium vulgare TaxID=1736751 RepID=A0ABV6ZYZ2_9PROT